MQRQANPISLCVGHRISIVCLRWLEAVSVAWPVHQSTAILHIKNSKRPLHKAPKKETVFIATSGSNVITDQIIVVVVIFLVASWYVVHCSFDYTALLKLTSVATPSQWRTQFHRATHPTIENHCLLHAARGVNVYFLWGRKYSSKVHIGWARPGITYNIYKRKSEGW